LRRWAADGACRGKDNAPWYPERGTSLEPARKVCAACPVRTECLAYALLVCERFGVWGGASERQRRKLRNVLREHEIDIDDTEEELVA
jgi:WhiB family redox-sensing transcriptional regulator